MVRAVVAMLAWLAIAASAHAQHPQRIALVVGNEAYSGALTRLNRPHEDAERIGDALRTTGFSVTQRQDQGRAEILKDVRALADRLKRAGPEAVGFFYYSGHGASALVGDRRRNYMIPVGTGIETPDDLVAEGVPLDDIIAILQGSRAKAIFIVFDACRSELPWSRGGSDPDKAFNAVSGGPGMFIAYSTAEGTSAPDDGAFAAALASQLLEAGKTHLAAFDAASRSVGRTRGADRRPWYSNQIDDDIYFASSAMRPGTLAAGTPGAATPVSPEAPAARVARAAAAAQSGRPVSERTFRDQLRDGTEGPELVALPTGSFLMGSPASELARGSDEGPQRRVAVPTFAAGKYEVTWTEYGACVSAGACAAAADDGFGKGARPVTNVSWNDAKAYVAWLTRETGKTYRLLSEAEWEYAARAGTTTPFNFGSTLSTSQANYDGHFIYGNGSRGEYRQKTAPVGSFPANGFGLHDLHGNVWEWVEDCYAAGYSAGQPSDGRAFTKGNCSYRVLRGGSWNDIPRSLRTADRYWYDPTVRSGSLGIRVARTL